MMRQASASSTQARSVGSAFPWAVSFTGLIDSPSYDHVILWEMVLFIFTLVLGLAYAWRKGVLEWNPKTEGR